MRILKNKVWRGLRRRSKPLRTLSNADTESRTVIGYPTDVVMRPASLVVEHRFAKVASKRRTVTVIYNYYKKESTLFKSLESLERQSWQLCKPEDIEIILI